MNVTLFGKKKVFTDVAIKNLDMRSSSIDWMSLKFKGTCLEEEKAQRHTGGGSIVKIKAEIGTMPINQELWNTFSLVPCGEAFLPMPRFSRVPDM